MIKAIIFDCFGVIYSDPAIVGFNKFSDNPDQQYKPFNKILDMVNKGLLSRDEGQQEIANMFGISLQQWQDTIGTSLVKDESIMTYIKQLKLNYKVALLTNLGPNRLEHYFTESELSSCFDVAVASGDIGFAKPEPQAFQYVLDKLDVLAEESIFTDDSQRFLDGASELGIKTILFENLHQLQNTLKVLSES